MDVPVIKPSSSKMLEINYKTDFWQSLKFDVLEIIIHILEFEFLLKNIREQYYLQTNTKLSLFTIRKILRTHLNLNYWFLRNSRLSNTKHFTKRNGSI